MKVLTIHGYDGPDMDDFCFGVEVEMAVQPLICNSPNCGCDRSYVGLGSRAASTTLMVREVDLDQFGGELPEGVTLADQLPVGTVLRPEYDRDGECWTLTEV